MHGDSIQSGYFSALAASSLTLFGIVFSLCLIGTQLLATRTNSAARKVFGRLTWLYLTMFIAITLWTMALSYRAGNSHESEPMRTVLFGHKECLSEVSAGRISILGIAFLLILLLPFIAYIYKRLSIAYIFSTIVQSALRARSTLSSQQKCDQLGFEILSTLPDVRAANEGFKQLLDLGVRGASRKRLLGRIDGATVALQVTQQLFDLNRQLSREPTVANNLVKKLEQWSVWLILYRGDVPGIEGHAHPLPPNAVRGMVRLMVQAATTNLRSWEISPTDIPCAQECVSLIQQVAVACRGSGLAMKLSDACIELSRCAIRRSADKFEVDFNMTLRSLIFICHISWDPRSPNLGRNAILRELTRLLQILHKTNDERDPLRSWVLDELHNLADQLTFTPSIRPQAWGSFIDSLGHLQPREVNRILRGPKESKDHFIKSEEHAKWQMRIVQQIRTSGDTVRTLRSQQAAAEMWSKDHDTQALMTLFNGIASDYVTIAEPWRIDAMLEIVNQVRNSVIYRKNILAHPAPNSSPGLTTNNSTQSAKLRVSWWIRPWDQLKAMPRISKRWLARLKL